jgi:two-component SAPR family response regulator
MPETNCERFVEQIRAERPGVRVIYISGYSEEILDHYGVVHLDSNFIRKPFSAKQLAEKIREVLGVERARSAGASEQR